MSQIRRFKGSILGPDGKPYNRDVLLGSKGIDLVANQYKGFEFFPNQDDLVDKKGIEIYDTIMRDAEVRQSVDAIRYAVISDYEIVPATTSGPDKEIADFIAWNFANLKNGSIQQFIFDALSSIYRGYSITEKIYAPCERGRWSGKWYLSELKPKFAGDYEIKTDEYLNITGLLNIATYTYAEVPIEKFIIHTHNPKDGRPHGQSVLRPVWKHYWAKDFLLKWWAIYCETFGMPTRVASYPANGGYVQDAGSEGASQQRLQDILSDIMNNTAITIPDDVELKFIEVSAGGALAFQKAIEYHDKEIKIAIQGQTLTSSVGDGKGSYALGDVHERTKFDYVKHVRGSIEDAVICEQIIRQLVDVNFETVDDYPRFRFIVDDTWKLTAQDVVMLTKTGFITNSDVNTIRKKIGLPRLDESEINLTPQAAVPGGGNNEPDGGGYSRAAKHARAGQFRREPNEYEKRVDFSKMKSDMDRADAAAMEALSPIVEKIKNKFLANLPKRVFPDDKFQLSSVMDLKLIGIDEFYKTLKAQMQSVLADQLAVAYRDTDNPKLKQSGGGGEAANETAQFAAPQNIKIDIRRNPTQELATLKGWYESENWDALRRWRGRKAAELAGNINARAFWVTDVMKTDILREVKNQIVFGIQGGADTRTIMKSVGGVFEKYIERGDIANKALAEGPRLETIVRTNTNRVFNMARQQANMEAAASGYFPAQEYSAILDDRVSDICEALDGQVYPTDDPIWGSIYPPNHFNCRSTVVGVYKDDVPEQWSAPPDKALGMITTEFGGQKETSKT